MTLGKYLALAMLIGGGMIIRALSTTAINPYWLSAGIIITVIAIGLFIRELLKL